MLLRFLQWTALPMEKPRAYGPFHLTFFLVGLAVAILLAWELRHTTEKQNRAVLLSAGVFLLLTELYKQLFYTFCIGGGTYQWWIFPFQLCSIPMYLCLLTSVLKKGKLRDGMYDFMLAFNLMSGFIAFLEPSGLVHEYWTLTVHAFLWHLLILFVGLYLGLSGRAGRRIKDYGCAVKVFAGLCIAAFSINLLFWRVSGGSINMFYVGPGISPLIVFEGIATRFGWYVNTPLYIACLCLAAFLFYLPFALWREKHALPVFQPEEEEEQLAG